MEFPKEFDDINVNKHLQCILCKFIMIELYSVYIFK